jgi:hypothetical protein
MMNIERRTIHYVQPRAVFQGARAAHAMMGADG